MKQRPRLRRQTTRSGLAPVVVSVLALLFAAGCTTSDSSSAPGFEIHRLLPWVVLNGGFDEERRKTGQVSVG